MSEKKCINYEVGHRRETRKSYQTFLEELMSDPAEETSGSAAETSDDGSVRRSKRTPIPKRGFKLIDDYDSKEPSAKKKCKGYVEEYSEQKFKCEKDLDEDFKEIKPKIESENDEEEKCDISFVVNNLSGSSSKKNIKSERDEEENNETDEQDANGSSVPKKSGRQRKAKTFEDCITPIKKHESKKPTELVCSDLSDAETEVLKKKVLAKLTANTPNQIKEEKIIGKDNVEYVYRNVFVTEILDSKRKRTCRLSKGSDNEKDETPKPTKNTSNDTNKDIENIESKKKKSDVKIKSTPDKTASAKSPKSCPNLNSSFESNDSKRRKSSSNIEKDTEVLNDKFDFKKPNEFIDNFKSTLEVVDSKRKRSSSISSLDKQDIKKSPEPKRTNIEISEHSDSSKRRTSSSLEIQPDIIEGKKKDKDLKLYEKKHKKHEEKKQIKSEEKKQVKSDEKKQIKNDEKKLIKNDEKKQIKHEEKKQIKHEEKKQIKSEEKKQVKSEEKKQIKHDEKKQIKHDEKKQIKHDEKKQIKHDEKKKVKFAEKEDVKVFEKDIELEEKPEELIPTLADSVKSRRKSKKVSIEDTSDYTSIDLPNKQNASPSNQDSSSRKNKRKTSIDDNLLLPKLETKEQKSPLKNDKSKSPKDKDSEKTTKENKKVIKSNEAVIKTDENESSLKKDVTKHSSKKKSSTIKKDKNDTTQNIPIESFEPLPKKKKSKSKQVSPSIINNDMIANGFKEESEEAPIVLTFKSSDITNISPPKKKEQKSHVYDKTSTKISKKTELKKNKKQNKKKTKKLIVSFKNNQSFQPKKKKSIEKEEQIIPPISPAPSSHDTSSDSSKLEAITPEKMFEHTPLPLEPLTEPLLDNEDEVKHKKKSKKKSKTKLKKHQKIVNVEMFTVSDQTVVKVKKKKIYKNRNGEKVLIRLIKNHCNKNGDIVKTETIMVDGDSPPVDDEKTNSTQQDVSKLLSFPNFEKSPVKSDIKGMENKVVEKMILEKTVPEKMIPEKSIPEKVLTTKEGKEKKVGDKKLSEKKTSEKKITEKKIVEKKNTEKIIPEKAIPEKLLPDKKLKEDSPEYFPHLNNDHPTTNTTATKRKSKFKHSSESKSNLNFKSSSEKRPMFKKSQKILKKPLSRPANKNVTVGGKVVGKTTKGMKKTGGDTVDQPVKSTVFEPIPPEVPTVPVTEPKNVYNFFCRKYRPIVVQQFPKADFSEISRRLAALWKTLSETERQDQRDKFEELHSVSQQKLAKLGRLSPTMWSESDLKFIKKNIAENDAYTEVFAIPKYPVRRLSPIDMAAHLSLLGDSLNVISGALQQQSSMTVHGAMSVLLDSILSALAPLVFFTSHIPEMKAIDDSQQARILDNLAYILPGL